MKQKTFLLVEDDELDVISFQRTLKKLGVECDLHVAYNGNEALKLLNDEESPIYPDVIILDLNMPKMNGTEFLKRLRADDKFKQLKVFVMTTSAEITDRTKTEELGISNYIIKPLGYTDTSKRANSMDSFTLFHLRKILMDEMEQGTANG